MNFNRVIGIVSCCVALVACGSTDGTAGPSGSDGPSGEPGVPGPAGQDGQNGVAGADGVAGPTGAIGSAGETGQTGVTGDIACGNDLISPAEWHSVCGSNVGSCKQGQVQCRLTSNEGELLANKVCYGEVAPAPKSGKCNLDDDCDGVKDNILGEGDNVTFVKQAWQYEATISGSSQSCDATLSQGRCRNAQKHCLLPDGDVCRADENGEGVLWSDFVADPREESLGFECADGQDVRTWECTVTDGRASVTCTGPRGL